MNNSVCDILINKIENQEGDIRTIGLDFYKNTDGRFDSIIKSWLDAGYTSQKVEWINYYPEKHFDLQYVDDFANEVGLKHIRSWISCVRPGKSAPWHQDIDDAMEDYLKLGELVRYTCFLNKPAVGQILIVDKNSYYMTPQSTIVKWNDVMDWHGASNCGFENQYLYHFLGYK